VILRPETAFVALPRGTSRVVNLMIPPQWDLNKSSEKLDELAATVAGAAAKRFLLLCHNNPDPDSIASAFGFQFLLNKKFGVRSIIGYGGVVTRAENKAMIQRLRIHMVQLLRVKPSDFFAIAAMDSQPGTGNNLLDARKRSAAIVIDHHPLRKSTLKADFHDVRPDYGATSTIITEYLVAAGLVPPRSVANALLYGIKTDTNALVRGASKSDFSAFKYLFPLTNPRMISRIEKPSLPLEYFREYQSGLAHTIIYRDVAVSWVGSIRSEAIIPELADVLLRIEGVKWSLCMGAIDQDLLILSMRSTSRSHDAGKVMHRLVGKCGSSGGHRQMAGGQMSLAGMTADDVEELHKKLVNKLLKSINRLGARPRPLALAGNSARQRV
jgi:nanoRNase/pAp phosphatase (c-di-AMP/oligoRNAs hydrolase)